MSSERIHSDDLTSYTGTGPALLLYEQQTRKTFQLQPQPQPLSAAYHASPVPSFAFSTSSATSSVHSSSPSPTQGHFGAGGVADDSSDRVMEEGYAQAQPSGQPHGEQHDNNTQEELQYQGYHAQLQQPPRFETVDPSQYAKWPGSPPSAIAGQGFAQQQSAPASQVVYQPAPLYADYEERHTSRPARESTPMTSLGMEQAPSTPGAMYSELPTYRFPPAPATVPALSSIYRPPIGQGSPSVLRYPQSAPRRTLPTRPAPLILKPWVASQAASPSSVPRYSHDSASSAPPHVPSNQNPTPTSMESAPWLAAQGRPGLFSPLASPALTSPAPSQQAGAGVSGSGSGSVSSAASAHSYFAQSQLAPPLPIVTLPDEPAVTRSDNRGGAAAANASLQYGSAQPGHSEFSPYPSHLEEGSIGGRATPIDASHLSPQSYPRQLAAPNTSLAVPQTPERHGTPAGEYPHTLPRARQQAPYAPGSAHQSGKPLSYHYQTTSSTTHTTSGSFIPASSYLPPRPHFDGLSPQVGSMPRSAPSTPHGRQDARFLSEMQGHDLSPLPQLSLQPSPSIGGPEAGPSSYTIRPYGSAQGGPLAISTQLSASYGGARTTPTLGSSGQWTTSPYLPSPSAQSYYSADDYAYEYSPTSAPLSQSMGPSSAPYSPSELRPSYVPYARPHRMATSAGPSAGMSVKRLSPFSTQTASPAAKRSRTMPGTPADDVKVEEQGTTGVPPGAEVRANSTGSGGSDERPKVQRCKIACGACRKTRLKCDGRTPCTSCIEKHLKVEPAASEADAVAAITRDSLCTYDAFVRRRGKGKKTIMKEEEELLKRSTSALLDRPQQQQPQIPTALQVQQPQPQQRSAGPPLYSQEPPLQFSRAVAEAASPAYLPLGGVGIGIGVAGMPGTSDGGQLLQSSVYKYPRDGLSASLGSSTMSSMSMSVPSGATAPASMSGSGSPESTDLTSSLAGTGLRMGKLNLDPALSTAPAGLQPPGQGQATDNPGNHNIRYF